MIHRIAAGALVVQDQRILLVRHVEPGAYDFWVAPGGGVVGTEDLLAAAKREAHEEADVDVEPIKIAFIEELYNPHSTGPVPHNTRQCKFWIVCRFVGGTASAHRPEATREHIVEARFLSRQELAGRTVFPPIFDDVFWNDLAHGFPQVRHLGLRQMMF